MIKMKTIMYTVCRLCTVGIQRKIYSSRYKSFRQGISCPDPLIDKLVKEMRFIFVNFLNKHKHNYIFYVVKTKPQYVVQLLEYLTKE